MRWAMLPAGALILLFLLAAAPLWFWTFCRIEPGPDQVAILVRKTGENLKGDQILALEEGQKGVQLGVLPTGRYFYNPYAWDWDYAPITDIPAGKLGVVTRLYGKDLPPGLIIAGEGQKGILSEVLRPGKHLINPMAFEVQLFDAVEIKSGYIGVIVALTGRDPLTDPTPGAPGSAQSNRLVVDKESKGVQGEVLDPGTHYLNPFQYSVIPVNLQSQRFEMSGEDVVTFLTSDGFNVSVQGTMEYAIRRETAAELTHRVGDMEDVLKKIILPRARGFMRIEGSKNPATSYIVGETRQVFQDSLTRHLTEQGKEWGIDIKSVLVRNITPPDQIASIIRAREVAVQEALKYTQQIDEARSQAELARQETLGLQNKEKVASDTERIRAVILAQQDQAVKLLAARQQLEVAKLEQEAAAAQAKAKLLGAEAQQQVIRQTNEAEASVIASQVKAFVDGQALARNELYRKLGPNIGSILASDQADGLGSIFMQFLQKGTAPAKAGEPAKGGAR